MSNLRMYQPAWIQLKSCPGQPLVISAASRLHPRIYKAIVKEKYMDQVFHLDLDFKNYTSRLSHTSRGNALTITLHLSPTIEGLFS